jgi:transporter family-2 protein
MALVGVLLAQQAPLNRGLSRATGAIPAAFVNFAVGLTLMLAACLAAGKLDGLGRIGPEWWHALGGISGALYVLVGLLVVRRIGASGVAAGAVTGQLFSSVVIDATGALGIEQRPLEWRVLVGAVAVLFGTYMVAGLPWRQGRRDGELPLRATLLPLAAMVLAGALVGIQIPLNGLLAQSTGDLASGLLNFLTGGAVLTLAVLLTGSARDLAGVVRVRWAYLGGGVCGAVNALVALTLVDQIGAGTVAAATVTGQMIASLAIDRVGLFDLERRPLSPRRLAGAALLVAGTILVAR